MSTPTESPDEALVREAARVLGTTGTTATIDRALATVIAGQRRREAVAAESRRLGVAAGDAAEGRPPDPPSGWLLDTSARGPAHEPAAAAEMRALLRSGELVTCPLLDLEALARSSHGHAEQLAGRRLVYRRVPLDEVIAARALALQAGAAEAVTARAGPAAAARALLLVATASAHGLGVLHADPLLGRVATVCGVRHRSPGVPAAGHVS
jgi:predicted nucleic acid-binding protein